MALDSRSLLVRGVVPKEPSEGLRLEGTDEASQTWEYRREKLEQGGRRSAKQSSSLSRNPGKASDYMRGTASQKPFTPAGFDPRQKILDTGLALSRLSALQSVKEGVSGAELTSLPRSVQEAKPFDLYDLSSRNADDFRTAKFSAGELHEMELRRARAAAEAGEHYIVGNENSSGVQMRLAQEGFRLDSVFKKGDDALFGLDDTEDLEDDLSDISEENSRQQDDEKEVQGEPRSELDEAMGELDILLGEEDETATKRKKKRGASEEWASEDNSDIANFKKIVPNPVKTYPFDLDPFQKRAIMHIERAENVFVSAHTSAGKTVVAEYAIALSESHHTKVIYTSPIKTLSNQKFRDFSETFQEVGIVTGDISYKQEASCLVMTTEILRSMLYKGADLIRDVEWVIFDEVHYVNDLERGVVWEEVIIMLPDHIRLVMLSATVPNALEFAEWVGRSRQSKVFVISTLKRPVPLEHSLFVGKNTHLILDASKKFLSKNFNMALKADDEGKSSVKGRPRHAWGGLAQYLKKEQLMPTVVFAFSKKKCEEAADSLRQTNFSDSSSDHEQVHSVFARALAQLNPVDRDLPQIMRVRDMLRRGIGVHHAGLLPIVKEVVEILFQRGVVKLLFATETFAMGVNMPARTVVFSSLRKHDGQQFRYLQPGEYTQMAGRAGRRGLDKTGNVLLYFPRGEIPSELEISGILTGRPLELVSQFRLTYNMILNLLRVEELRVEDMMRRSFAEAPAKRDTKKVKKLIEKGTKVLEDIRSNVAFLSRFENYYSHWNEVREITRFCSEELFELGGRSLTAGRLVIAARKDRGMSLGLVLRSPKKVNASLLSKTKEMTLKTLFLLRGPGKSKFYKCESTSNKKAEHATSWLGPFEYIIQEVPPQDILSILQQKLKLDFEKLSPMRGPPDNYSLSLALEELRKLLEEDRVQAVDVVDPRSDLKIRDFQFLEAWDRKLELLALLESDPVADSSRLSEALDSLERMHLLEVRLSKLQWASSDESLQLLPDYLQRIQVLKRMNYISDDNIVQLKGRSACQVNTCDSLILTELIFENVLKELEPEQCAALLTALVCQEKTDEQYIPEELEKTKQDAETIVYALAVVQEECGLPVSALEYARLNLNWAMTELVLHWARGETFTKTLESAPDIPEGSIVRCVVRLSELLRETRNVAGVIGDVDLFNKMEIAMAMIKRDIIFAASLYLQ